MKSDNVYAASPTRYKPESNNAVLLGRAVLSNADNHS
jgi:hypothetical protein